MKGIQKKVGNSQIIDRIGLIIALVAIVSVFSIFNHNFFSMQNMINILMASSLIGLVAIGETYLIISGSVDLSAGSVAAFASVLSAVLLSKGVNTVFTVGIVLAVGAGIGYVNALSVTKLKLEPFIATLATMSIFRGFAYILCGGRPIFINNQSFIKLGSHRIFGLVSFPIIVLIVGFIVFGIILNRTRFGRNTYVLGGNKYAARLAGVNPTKITVRLFIMTSMLASLGGLLLAARMNSGQPSACDGLEFDAVTAAVLGGTAFSGGVGTLLGTVLGVFILQGFNTGLIMINVQTFWQYVARGMLLLTALAFDYYRKTNREKKGLAKSILETSDEQGDLGKQSDE